MVPEKAVHVLPGTFGARDQSLVSPAPCRAAVTPIGQQNPPAQLKLWVLHGKYSKKPNFILPKRKPIHVSSDSVFGTLGLVPLPGMVLVYCGLDRLL